MNCCDPIGVFDSGIGGLSLVSEIKRQLPRESMIYFADVARQPFGEKTREEVISISCEIADYLEAQNVKAIVIACSTATAAALETLKKRYPFPVIGIITDRLVRDVLAVSKNKKIGIISTELTAKTGSFKKAIQTVCRDAQIYPMACSRLVNMISEGDIFDEEIYKTAVEFIAPLLEAGVDTIILGCTHFNFISDTIEKVAGAKAVIVSPPLSTISHLKDVLAQKGLLCGADKNFYNYYATGDTAAFSALVKKLWRENDNAQIRTCRWAQTRRERSKI